MILLFSTVTGCKETSSALDTPLQFSEATQEANLEYSGPSYTASVADVNGDGWPDIAVSQHQQLMLYLNRNGLFTPSLLFRGDIHGLAWLDWNNDALPDLYVSRGGGRGCRFGRTNRLFMNENGLFVDVTEQSGTGDTGVGQDALSADFDHEGDLDLYVLNGRDIFGNPPNVLYENLGDGRFRAVTAEANAEGTPLGRGASVLDFDYDRDGDLDLFITNGSGPAPGNDGPVQLLRNDSITGHWLQVDLRTVQSNTMALGARLTLETPGLRQTREVTAATGRATVSWRPIHFGMAEAADGTLTVDWPGGLRSVLRVEANQFVTVTEPES
jgi:hypothetical protein